jgi:hypothetical protein
MNQRTSSSVTPFNTRDWSTLPDHSGPKLFGPLVVAVGRTITDRPPGADLYVGVYASGSY